MKVLLIIGAYGFGHYAILWQNIRIYRTYSKYQFDITVMATQPMPLGDDKLQFRYFDSALGMNFLWKHQAVIKEKEAKDFDLLVFTEDDVLITEDNLDYFVEHGNRLVGTDYLCGFISYENWGDERYLHSMTLDSWKMGQPVTIKDTRYWSVSEQNMMLPNVHQCCFVFDRPRFDDLVRQDLFYVEPEVIKYGRGNRYLGPRESATNWIWKHYYRKVWAIDDIERGLILHCDHYSKHPIGPNVEEFIRAIK